MDMTRKQVKEHLRKIISAYNTMKSEDPNDILVRHVKKEHDEILEIIRFEAYHYIDILLDDTITTTDRPRRIENEFNLMTMGLIDV